MGALTSLRSRGWVTAATVGLLVGGSVLTGAALPASSGDLRGPAPRAAWLLVGAASAVALALLLVVLRERRARARLGQAIGEVTAAARDAARGRPARGLSLGADGAVGDLAAAVAALVDRVGHSTPLSEDDLAVVATTPRRPSRAMEPVLEEVLPEPGQLFADRYEILDVLGRSDVRTAFRVRDRESGELRVLKTLHPGAFGGDSRAVAQFKADLRIVRRLAHPNILRTYDFGEVPQYFVTMELLEAIPVHDLLRREGRLDLATTLAIAFQASRALSVAHREGVLHRDVRPQSLLLGAGGLLKLADFGLATTAQRTRALVRTAADADVIAYVPPEVLRSQDVDARSDLYSLAVVLFRCVAGRLPQRADAAGSAEAPVEPLVEPLSSIDPAVPSAFSELVAETLSPDPRARPASADAFRQRLARVGALVQ